MLAVVVDLRPLLSVIVSVTTYSPGSSNTCEVVAEAVVWDAAVAEVPLVAHDRIGAGRGRSVEVHRAPGNRRDGREREACAQAAFAVGSDFDFLRRGSLVSGIVGHRQRHVVGPGRVVTSSSRSCLSRSGRCRTATCSSRSMRGAVAVEPEPLNTISSPMPGSVGENTKLAIGKLAGADLHGLRARTGAVRHVGDRQRHRVVASVAVGM